MVLHGTVAHGRQHKLSPRAYTQHISTSTHWRLPHHNHSNLIPEVSYSMSLLLSIFSSYTEVLLSVSPRVVVLSTTSADLVVASSSVRPLVPTPGPKRSLLTPGVGLHHVPSPFLFHNIQQDSHEIPKDGGEPLGFLVSPPNGLLNFPPALLGSASLLTLELVERISLLK